MTLALVHVKPSIFESRLDCVVQGLSSGELMSVLRIERSIVDL